MITPAQLHMQIEMLSSAGWLPSKTVGAPGVQGEAVAGMQGCGVSTPSAAEVAAATCRIGDARAHPERHDVDHRDMVHDVGAELMLALDPVDRQHDEGSTAWCRTSRPAVRC